MTGRKAQSGSDAADAQRHPARGKNTLASAIYAVLTVVLVALLAYSLYHALGIYIPLLREKARYDQLRESASATAETGEREGIPSSDEVFASAYAELYQANEDMVGWLKIDDTEIDYPVMKSSEDDPEFYLRRDFDKNYALAGCLFVGGGATVDSDFFIIYGHNMSDESMFGSLDLFKEYDFMSKHSEFTFETATEKRVYRVFSAFETQIYDEGAGAGQFTYYDHVGDYPKGEYETIVQSLRDLSLYSIPAAPEYPQQVLMLSTCSYHTDKGRFVVAAYRVK